MTVNSRISDDAKVLFKALLSSGKPCLCGECGKGNNTIGNNCHATRESSLNDCSDAEITRPAQARPWAFSLFYITPFSFFFEEVVWAEPDEWDTGPLGLLAIASRFLDFPVAWFAWLDFGFSKTNKQKASSILSILACLLSSGCFVERLYWN